MSFTYMYIHIYTYTCIYTHVYRGADMNRYWQPTPVFLPGKSHGLRSLAGYEVTRVRHDLVTKQQQLYIYYIIFIHSAVDGHLGCFLILAIVNNVALNISVSFQVSVFGFFSDTYPGLELLDLFLIL